MSQWKCGAQENEYEEGGGGEKKETKTKYSGGKRN
jgi:hypothetical protein